MDTNKEAKAIEAARRNELHASHDAMEYVGEVGGKAQVRCACGVLLAVDLQEAAPPEQPAQPTRRRSSRDEGGE